jgi:transposase-like protein
MELHRQLDFGSYETAWTWLHKIRMAMVNPDRTQLHKEVEIDETYIQTGKAGRGRALGGQKALIICAVEVKDTKKGKVASGRIRLRHLSSASKEQIHPFVKDHVEKGAIVRTDGWKGYKGLSKYGYEHIPETVGDPKLASKKFPRVHRVFANLKSWLIGTHRYVSTKHLQNYLNEYMFRFNRRYYRESSFDTLLRIALLDRPREYEGFVKPKRPFYANPAKNG